MQKRSFCRRSFPHFFRCWKKWGRRRQKKRSRGGRRPGGEQVLRLRARDGEFRAPARVTFFFCKKKVTKENHLDLRSKGPLARGGQVRIWRGVLAGGVQRSSLSVKRTVPAFTGAEADAAACFSHGRRFSLLPPSPKAFPLDGYAVLNDTPVACQTRGPTRRETGGTAKPWQMRRRRAAA